MLVLLLDVVDASIVSTSGVVTEAREHLYKKNDSILQCDYIISVPEGKAQGTFDGPCRYPLGDKIDLDVRIANITGIVTIVGGTVRKGGEP